MSSIQRAAPVNGAIRTARWDESMRGNVCRCGAYQAIRSAIHTAAQYQAEAKGGKK